MANVLVWNTHLYDIHAGMNDDEAYSLAVAGNKVMILECDSLMGGCHMGQNTTCSKGHCIACRFMYNHVLKKKFCHPNIRRVKLSDYKHVVDFKDIPDYSYIQDVSQLAELEYRGVAVGRSTYSYLVSCSRNINIPLTPINKAYALAFVRKAAVLTQILEYIIKEQHIEKLVFFNGRMSILRPPLDLARKYNLQFTCTSTIWNDKWAMKKFFQNSGAHEMDKWAELIRSYWEKSTLTEQERRSVGERFYTNRRNALPAGDRVYTAQQDLGKLPDDWDDTKHNVVIFNSSEDECSALGGKFETYKLFPTQLEGIKVIASHYAGNEGIHIYLRVHPNLRTVKYDYHTDLYKLNYPNLTVIPADSPISTYTLMDKADKVLTFGSSTSIEACYWGKPVINMRFSPYFYLNCTYYADSLEKLWTLIEDWNLPALSKEDALKYGFFFMDDHHERFKYLDASLHDDWFHTTCTKNIGYANIWGSRFLYFVVLKCMTRFLRIIYPPRFKGIFEELRK